MQLKPATGLVGQMRTVPPWPSILPALVFLAGCERPPDVVFITIDTLRADHVGAINPESPAKTPYIDGLAAEGVTYLQAYSPISVTGPAFCTLHTGKAPASHGVVMNTFRGGAALSDKVETLAERLAAEGYATGAFVSGFTLRKSLNLNQGFETYSQPKHRRRPGDETASRMWTWLAYEPAPVFLWYHTYDPHGPLGIWDHPKIGPRFKRGGPELDRIPSYQLVENISDPRFYQERYATAVNFADAQVGRILSMLKNSGRYDNALIVLTADHGETFTERELWFDHGTSAHEEQLHVPLIIRFPDHWGAGRREEALVGLQDVYPTVLDSLGLTVPTDIDGVSIREAGTPGHASLEGESSHCKSEPVLRCTPKGPGGKMFAVRTAENTLIREPLATGPEWRLYDRNRDRPERRPLEAPSLDGTMVAQIDRMAELRRAMNLQNPDEATEGQSAEEIEALRELGYMAPEAPSANPSPPVQKVQQGGE